jgi:molybdopterin-synthase adenylyltransferase
MKERSKRQSFLGDHSDRVLQDTTIAIVGVSGGGTPIAQQIAHIGFGTAHLIDADFAEEHHRHRLVGITSAAVKYQWKKVRVAERLMRRVHPEGRVTAHPHPWQEVHEVLRSCDIVFSCLDGYLGRDELERYLRRFHVPLIDIGMDVARHVTGHTIYGQAILSLPGAYCMRCFGFIRDELLAEEARRYGDAGERAQVIWPNGALASSAVGIAMSLLLPWHSSLSVPPYLVYDGNRMEITASPRLQHLRELRCTHYDASVSVGDPTFRGSASLRQGAAIAQKRRAFGPAPCASVESRNLDDGTSFR